MLLSNSLQEPWFVETSPQKTLMSTQDGQLLKVFAQLVVQLTVTLSIQNSNPAHGIFRVYIKYTFCNASSNPAHRIFFGNPSSNPAHGIFQFINFLYVSIEL